MGLQLTGKVLEVVEDTVTPGPGATWSAFTSVKFRVLSGKSDILEVVASDDLPRTAYPREGEDVTFEVGRPASPTRVATLASGFWPWRVSVALGSLRRPDVSGRSPGQGLQSLAGRVRFRPHSPESGWRHHDG